MSSAPPAHPSPAPAPAAAPPSPGRGLTATGGALLVALVAVAASWNVLLNGFVWDDAQNILLNPWVREPGRIHEAFLHDLAGFDPRLASGYYRPVMHVVFWATYALAGARPWPFHLVNLAAHAAMSACVYLVLVRWSAHEVAREAPSGPIAQGGRPWDALASGSLVAALIFAVHPIHTQPVAWIAGIVDLSYSLLFVVAFLWATHEGPRRGVPLVAAPAAFFLALLSKEPAIVLLPIVALALALRGGLRDPERRRDTLARLAALSLAVLPYLALRLNALGALLPATPGRLHVGVQDGAATALAVLAGYLRLLVAPVRLSALRDPALVAGFLDRRALAALPVLLAFGAAAWALRRRPAAALGTALLVLPLLPALYVPVLRDHLGAERYAYLPSAGAALLLASAVDAWRARAVRRAAAVRLAIACAAGIVLLAATGATVAQNAVWRDELALWTDAVAKAPSSASAQESLGNALIVAGRPDDGIPALERAIALAPERAEPRMNLASALVAVGRVDEGLAAAEVGVRALPSVAEAHGILGLALAANGRPAEAVAAYQRALALNPSLPDVHIGLAAALDGLGRRDLAVEHVREAIRLQPENPRYRQDLALLLGQ